MKRSEKIFHDAGQVAVVAAVLLITGVICIVWAAAVGVNDGCVPVMLAAAAFCAACERVAETIRLARLARLEKTYEITL